MNHIASTIRDFILSRYLQGESPENLREDTPLRTSGVLDSLATLGLVSFLEQQYEIEIEAHETDIENFNSLGQIAAFVEHKQSQR